MIHQRRRCFRGHSSGPPIDLCIPRVRLRRWPSKLCMHSVDAKRLRRRCARAAARGTFIHVRRSDLRTLLLHILGLRHVPLELVHLCAEAVDRLLALPRARADAFEGAAPASRFDLDRTTGQRCAPRAPDSRSKAGSTAMLRKRKRRLLQFWLWDRRVCSVAARMIGELLGKLSDLVARDVSNGAFRIRSRGPRGARREPRGEIPGVVVGQDVAVGAFKPA
mmetsp:Transcript_112632/g.318160  ORF Transcript_112632/g.318160 Transcript_112632/m.318160 type:complete len:221 (+) Transcript_112632:1161-1823(+)